MTDDQGWRIEIKRYPKLIEVGAKLPNFSGQTGEGWFYSQADIKEIVAYAADRHVTVVPEIEMPGHSGAATTSYPELSCDGKPASELCAGKESTFQFMANVLDEVAEVVPLAVHSHRRRRSAARTTGAPVRTARSGWTNWPPPSRPRACESQPLERPADSACRSTRTSTAWKANSCGASTAIWPRKENG